ncbi:MAG: carbohydrate porin, partial [Chthoniobacterales bacterium]
MAFCLALLPFASAAESSASSERSLPTSVGTVAAATVRISSEEMQRPAAASGPYRADDFAPEKVFSTASHYLQASNNPIGLEFFVDYFGVFQGNPVGGQSQAFAYSQYLPFGFEWKEPFGWHGGGVRVSAVSAAGRNLSESIGNAFTVSQAWADNTLFLYQAYLVQKAFDDKLEVGIGRVAAAQ